MGIFGRIKSRFSGGGKGFSPSDKSILKADLHMGLGMSKTRAKKIVNRQSRYLAHHGKLPSSFFSPNFYTKERKKIRAGGKSFII